MRSLFEKRENRLIIWRLLPLLIFQLIWLGAIAQKQVSGTITDAGGNPLEGATITLKGTTTVVVSDDRGKFSIPVQSGVLIFSHVGFQEQEITISSQSQLSVKMLTDQSSLSGVVVVGYGKQSRELVTTAISKLDTTVLKNVPFTNPAYALQGTLPGVRVTSTSGQPGAAPLIVVRGGTSFDPNTSYPLYVIDGVISPDLTAINSNDIESIQVLKDAASTAIYGARGSNGVVIVTTKSGKAGRAQITYNYNLGFSNYTSKMKMLDARDFIYYNRLGIQMAAVKWPFFEAILSSPLSAGTGNDLTNNTFYTTQYLTPENQHKLNEGWESMPDPIDPTKTIIFKGTDWRDVMFRTGVTNNHNITASGGSDKGNYSISVGYMDVKGVAIQTGYKRLSLNTKGELKLRDNLKVFSNIRYAGDMSDKVSDESNIFGRMLQVAPTVKYAFEDGTLSQGQNGGKGNPLYRTGLFVGGSEATNAAFTVGGQWDIIPGLSFMPQVSLLTRNSTNRLFVKSNYDGLNYDQTRSASESRKGYKQQGADAVFAYNKSFSGVHNLEVTAGYSYLKTEETSLSASGRGAATDLIPTLNASAIPVGVSSARTYYTYMGFFGRINYNYDQKYLVSLNSRYDASSNLGTKHKWGYFPGISVGWNVHKENFWAPLADAINQLKFRASYGVNGNVNALGAYQAQGSYSGGAVYGGRAGILNTGLSNDELKWEQTKTFDLGVDLSFLNNRVGVTADYFKRVTSNLLSSRTLPQSTGFGSILTNLGTLQNKGIELAAYVQPIKPTKNFQWNLSFNAAYEKNKIVKLPENGAPKNRIGGEYVWDNKTNSYEWLGGLQEGGVMGELYAFQQIGIYQTDAEAAKAPYDILPEGTDKTKFAGDVIFLDNDKNDTIDNRDRIYMGNIYPTWTGGISSTVSYKGFSFIVRLDYMTGQTIYNYMRATTTAQLAGDLGLNSDVAHSWLKEGDQTDIPRLYYGDWQYNIGRGTSPYYEKGNYLALREVTFSYDLSATLLKRTGLKGLRINVSGQNLHYFTKYKGINPENGGTDNGSYPISRNFLFGATISL
ncbi:MAG: TonB-dependent receptor [Sphingobacteriales bacterium]|nr:TonB-dependent receptor [Sphingobacteriales bacterium]